MDAAAVLDDIRRRCAGVRLEEYNGDTFITYDPAGDLPEQGWQPFATLVTGDHYDTVSALEAPGDFRLNVGLTKRGYTDRLGEPPGERGPGGVLRAGVDYAARDRVLPHPHYASQHWVCVVCPGPRTAAEVPRLVAEAYDFAVRRDANRRARRARR